MLYKQQNRVKTVKFGAALPLFLCMAFKSVQGRGLRRRPAGGPGAAAFGCGPWASGGPPAEAPFPTQI